MLQVRNDMEASMPLRNLSEFFQWAALFAGQGRFAGFVPRGWWGLPMSQDDKQKDTR